MRNEQLDEVIDVEYIRTKAIILHVENKLKYWLSLKRSPYSTQHRKLISELREIENLSPNQILEIQGQLLNED